MSAFRAVVLSLLVVPMLAFGRNETTQITLGLPEKTIAIIDADSLARFRFGTGPGNFSVDPGSRRVPNWRPNSWIVEDWAHPVAAPAAALPRLKCSFQVNHGSGNRDYVVFHVFDPATLQGYVYLPGKGEAHYSDNIFLLNRGDEYDGRWFRATAEWTARVRDATKGASK